MPLKLESKGTDGGTITFANYNKSVSIAALPQGDGGVRGDAGVDAGRRRLARRMPSL